MEKEFFKWEDWDQVDTLALIFYGCTLIKQIGEYPPGYEADSITVDYERGCISIYNDDTNTRKKYKLNLSIGDEFIKD